MTGFRLTMLHSMLTTIIAATTLVNSNPQTHRHKKRVSAVGGGITKNTTAISCRTFDYVICGGGYASMSKERTMRNALTELSSSLTGLTVASRLTEDPDISVLVIEAGYDNSADPRVNDVRTYGEAFGTDIDWNLTSTPVSW